MMNFSKTIFILSLCLCLYPSVLAADEMVADDKTTTVEASPKDPWKNFEVVEAKKETTLSKTLLYLPNRIIDFLDIFRVDVGVGPATGAVLRLTRHAQMGYRNISPMSVRVGLFGRKPPLLVESSNEIGIGPAFIQSKDRNVCTSEFGLGLDILFIGGYGGICLEEVFDFFGGVFLYDPKNDDRH